MVKERISPVFFCTCLTHLHQRGRHPPNSHDGGLCKPSAFVLRPPQTFPDVSLATPLVAGIQVSVMPQQITTTRPYISEVTPKYTIIGQDAVTASSSITVPQHLFRRDFFTMLPVLCRSLCKHFKTTSSPKGAREVAVCEAATESSLNAPTLLPADFQGLCKGNRLRRAVCHGE